MLTFPLISFNILRVSSADESSTGLNPRSWVTPSTCFERGQFPTAAKVVLAHSYHSVDNTSLTVDTNSILEISEFCYLRQVTTVAYLSLENFPETEPILVRNIEFNDCQFLALKSLAFVA